MLTNALINLRLPHALLFTGEDGVGKSTAAFELAGICNCTRSGVGGRRGEQDSISPEISACGSCRSCRKIRHGTHPDIHTIKPTGGYTRIEQIRSLCGSLSLKPNAASTRFVLIEDAHLMNTEAGNALLKILEEPPDSTIFVLTAPDTMDILPTIVSRCRHIRFNPIPQKELADYIVSSCGLTRQNAMIVASISGGSLSRAIDRADTNWIDYRNFIVQTLGELPGMPAASRYAFAEMLAADRNKLESVFEIMKNWYRDIAVYPFSPENIYYHDLSEHIKTAALKMPLHLILEKADAVFRAEKAAAGNANLRLTLDAMVTKLSQQETQNSRKEYEYS